jgi:hypothetical protein
MIMGIHNAPVQFAADPGQWNHRCSVQYQGGKHVRIAGTFVAGRIPL